MWQYIKRAEPLTEKKIGDTVQWPPFPKFQILNECHDRTHNPYCLILSKVIIGLKLCQQNQRYGCSEDLLESYGIPKLPKCPKI